MFKHSSLLALAYLARALSQLTQSTVTQFKKP